MDRPESDTAAAPVASLKRRRERLEVTATLGVTGFGRLNMGRGYPVTLESVTVTAVEDNGSRSVTLTARGRNEWGVAQYGTWSLPHPSTAHSSDPYNPYHGLVTELPQPLLEAVEAASGIRFADYQESQRP
ncbi:hypothetical protein [Pseudactinotalea terrae]|uniref:hypothetical protein n=1 Tax=Pseudactinotalea terrae TaxID=1743262 RepID=UPI0012E2BC0A|nr:hypothetical protein [Pseudactinotalea terrae]